MAHSHLWAVGSLLMLAGCDMTVDVQGLLGEDEPLVGSLTHYSDGGTIELIGGPRTHCVGSFTYSRSRRGLSGKGALVCNDRCSGPFQFVMKGARHGQGQGLLSGVTYSFRF